MSDNFKRAVEESLKLIYETDIVSANDLINGVTDILFKHANKMSNDIYEGVYGERLNK